MNPRPIELISSGDEQAIRRHLQTNTPFVFQVADGAGRAERWTISQLCMRVGDRPCRVAVSPSRRHEYDAQKGLRVERMPFSQFAERAFREGAREHLYLQDDLKSLPDLREDAQLPPLLRRQRLTQSKLLVSPGASITSLHYDPVETYLEQLVGRKRILFFPPGVKCYYPHGWRTKAPFVSQVVNAAAPDLARFPRFAQAMRFEAELRPGQIVYIPFGWWHEVHSLDEVNVSVNHRWFPTVGKTAANWAQFARSLPVITSFLVGKAGRRLRTGLRGVLTGGSARPSGATTT